MMLVLVSVSATIALLLIFTKFLPQRRKRILFLMQVITILLLESDRAAYLLKGSTGAVTGFMVRFSNFMVFFLTSAMVLVFNLYLIDVLMTKAQLKEVPKTLKLVNIRAAAGMALVVLAHFTGFYYYFDEDNIYHRGPGFVISYIIPVLFPIIQYTVIHRYRAALGKLMYASFVVYIFVPIIVGIVQIFTYGISIVNMAMVLVSVSLYIFAYLDINAEIVRAHAVEVGTLQKEQQSMKRLFDQTVTAFMTAAEKRDPDSEGHSVRVADCARRIAEAAGKTPEKCEEVYYAALLHDAGMMEIPDTVIKKSGRKADQNASKSVCPAPSSVRA